ncbi:MAG: HAD family hydrolase [Rhodobacteraceae bacterium]|nr:HAD family hydrolase [Paracoccaceae bacterium]
MRIAMWSGPRNISTAMMYAFAVRTDFAVVDEPFYAAYLHLTGIDHPMRDAIIASQATDPKAVIGGLLGPIPEGKPHFYQKHMTQHMVGGIPRGWLDQVTNVFLIRHPARVIASYAAKRENPTLDDLGYRQQAELFDRVSQKTGKAPLVLDSVDIRRDPARMLAALCSAIGLTFQPAMLAWPKGGHKQDGIWAAHWYQAVWRSTGFAGPEGELPELVSDHRELADQAQVHYQQMVRWKI